MKGYLLSASSFTQEWLTRYSGVSNKVKSVIEQMLLLKIRNVQSVLVR